MSDQSIGKEVEDRSTALAWMQRAADELARSFAFWCRKNREWAIELDDCREVELSSLCRRDAISSSFGHCAAAKPGEDLGTLDEIPGRLPFHGTALPPSIRKYLRFVEPGKMKATVDHLIAVLYGNVDQGVKEENRLAELAQALFVAVRKWMPDLVDMQSRKLCEIPSRLEDDLDGAAAWWEHVAVEALKRGAAVPANGEKAAKQTASRPGKRVTFEMAGAVAETSKQQAHRKFNDGSGNVDCAEVVFAAYQKKLSASKEEERDAQSLPKPRVGQLCKCLKPGCDWTGDATKNRRCPEDHVQGIEPIARPRRK